MTVPSVALYGDDVAPGVGLHAELRSEGFAVSVYPDVARLLDAVETRTPDLLLLDWASPKATAFETLRAVRRARRSGELPILVMSAHAGEDWRVRGLDEGADDFLSKPCGLGELLSRVKALLRRHRPGLADPQVVFGDIALDRVARRVRRDGHVIHLSPSEYRLLDFLIRQPRKVFSREDLRDAVSDSQPGLEPRTIDVLVGRLRKALTAQGGENPIRTVRTAGYALDLD